MKKRFLALLLLAALCMTMLAACNRSPSKETVEKYARDVLEATVRQDTATLRALANPDYEGYFSDEEMKTAYAKYEAWGIREGSRVGSMRLLEWYANEEYPGGLGSIATYEVSIGGVFYEYDIEVVETDAGVGVVFYDLSRLD